MDQTQRTNLIRYLYKAQETKDMVFTMSGGVPLYPELATKMHNANDTKPRNLLLKNFWIHDPIGCHAGIEYFSLRPNGDIYPCTFLPIKVGNIREKSLIDIWLNSPILNQLRQRSQLKGKCRDCEYRQTCGGCRGRAYACSNDYLETDPVCLRELLLQEKIHPASINRFGWCVG
jgi:radical SAM protein with 4Fe4S-binding SPASM domain